MLRRILTYKGGSGAAAHAALNSGAPLALLVNNLGGTSNLELAAVVNEALKWLAANGVRLVWLLGGRGVADSDPCVCAS
jgi:dihydroxyacetone kinase